jgi:DNA-binding NtrC family response regulator
VKPRAFSTEVLRRFRAYPWPGNVRELKNHVERLTCLDKEGPVTAADLPPELLAHPEGPRTFEEQVEAFQVNLLLDALRKADGSQKNAAASLGLTYDQFRHMVRKYDLMDRLKT